MTTPNQTPQNTPEARISPEVQQVAEHLGNTAVAHGGWTDEIVKKYTKEPIPELPAPRPIAPHDKLHDTSPGNDIHGGL